MKWHVRDGIKDGNSYNVIFHIPVVVNKSGQTLGSTAGDHSIVLTPVEEAVEDTV